MRNANEKLYRIKSAFTKALEKNYKKEIPAFIPHGKRGEAIAVSVETGRVKNEIIVVMIGKTRTNIRAEIDNQYEILSQMIEDLSIRYQAEYNDADTKVEKIIEDIRCNDSENYLTVSYSFNEHLGKQYSLCVESRKVLFCAIFSYFESMLYGIINYYHIPRKEANKVKQLLGKISEEYHNRESKDLELKSNIDIILNFYSLLRNKFMHGCIDYYKNKLQLYVERTDDIGKVDDKYEIKNNEFLTKVLHDVYAVLVDLDEAFYKTTVRK